MSSIVAPWDGLGRAGACAGARTRGARQPRAQSAATRRPKRVSRSRRRYRYQSDADGSCDRGGVEDSEADRPEALAKEITRAALLGSRGNSGVIFSQIVRGFADVAGEYERIDSPVLARAFRSASDSAYGALRAPVEGTILTVIREMAEEESSRLCKPWLPTSSSAEWSFVARMPSRGRPSCSTSFARPVSSIPEERACSRSCAGWRQVCPARRSLRSRSQATLRGRRDPPGALAVPLLHDLRRRGGRSGRRVARTRARTDRRFAARRRRRHRAQGACAYGRSRALRSRSVPRSARSSRPSSPTCTSRRGSARSGSRRRWRRRSQDGNRRRRSRGGEQKALRRVRRQHVVEGGQTMNPSTAEMLAAIEASPAPAVIVLPNNSNVILSAEQAAGMHPSRSGSSTHARFQRAWPRSARTYRVSRSKRTRR